MFKIVTPDRMRDIEAAIDSSGTSYQTLMERAGRAAADRALAILQEMSATNTDTNADKDTPPRVTVLVGPGNNGGDGLITGLLIAQDNPDADVRFYLLKERPDDDPYMPIIKDVGLFYAMADDDGDKRVLRNMVASSDLVIDALFGISVRLPLRDEAAKVLRAVNRALTERRTARPDSISIDPARPGQIARAPRVYVLAIDMPSGLDGETGKLDAAALHADETITFIAAKQGQFMFPGAQAVGALRLANLEIAPTFDDLKSEQTTIIDAETIRNMLPAREADSHKGSFGKALIVSGSLNFMGAPALCAEAAYRAGAGLVTIATPRPLAATLAAQLREPTWLLLPHDMGVIAESAVSVLVDEIDTYKSLLIGPGLGTDKTTRDFLAQLLAQSTKQAAPPKRKLGFASLVDDDDETHDEQKTVTLPPLVIDADGLNLLAEMDDNNEQSESDETKEGQITWHKRLPENTIITPHPGEMARLAKMDTREVVENRWTLAREKAAEWQTIILLKGAHTLIAHPDGRMAVLPFKNHALATAGTGDVLAGLIAGLLAQGIKPYEAAIIGGYLHGFAGDIAAAHIRSGRSMIAGDVIHALATAFGQIEA